jgi:hypothetical protein
VSVFVMDGVAVAFYAITAPLITTIAHLCAVVLGICLAVVGSWIMRCHGRIREYTDLVRDRLMSTAGQTNLLDSAAAPSAPDEQVPLSSSVDTTVQDHR